MAATVDRVAAPGRAVPRSGALLTDLLLLLMAAIWGINYSVVKYGTRLVAPLSYNAVRIALAAVALGVAAWWLEPSRLSRRDALVLLGLGVIGNGVYQVCFIEGVSRSRAGTVALVAAAGPAFTALVGRLVGTERVSRRGWLGISLQLAGVASVVLGSAAAPRGDDTALGAALILVGAACWALYAALLKPYTERLPHLHIGALTLAGGALLVGAVAIPSLAREPWPTTTPIVWLAITYSGIGALVIANLIWYRGVHRIGPTRTSMYSNVQPLIALAVAWIALGEVPTLWQGVGVGGIVSGLLVARP
jgi:drug/metabolite transporter (DMT)-like permease